MRKFRSATRPESASWNKRNIFGTGPYWVVGNDNEDTFVSEIPRGERFTRGAGHFAVRQ